MKALPSWVGKTVAGALITALIAGGLGWASHVSTTQGKQTEEIATLKESKRSVEKDIDDIKNTQRRMEDKLDRALERR